MKAVPILIAAVAVVLIRLGLRRRRTSSRSRPDRRRTSSRSRPDRLLTGALGRVHLGDTGLVAAREIHERIRSRMFRAVTLVLLLVVAAAVIVPTLHSGAAATTNVGIVAGSPSLRTELEVLARSAGVKVDLVSVPDDSRARAAVSSGQLDVVVEGGGAILVNAPVSAADASPAARYVRAVSQTLGVERAFARAGLSPQQAAIVSRARPLPVESLQPGKTGRTTSEATALLGVVLIFVVLTQYLTWTLMGVMEEKASRVVEVLLATVRPIQLLAGKVIGIGAVALAQAAALVAFAFLLGAAVGSSLVRGTAPLVVAATLVWLVLGYAFYSWVYAAAGSLAERQDQVQSLVLPLSAPLIFGYLVSLIGVSSGNVSLLVKVLAYLPPTAPFAMPTLVGFGEATWWQFLLSAVACLASTLAVALAAARVYRAAVLQTGGRVRLRGLIRRSTI